jgi:Xaa-Pro aminopeptidase
MVKESMLTKEEKQWLKVRFTQSASPVIRLLNLCISSQDHNARCLDKLLPYLKDDKRATAWLKREAGRGIGLASVPGGINVDWG